MSVQELDEMGPVDYRVVEFPPGHQNFTGEMAAELCALADKGDTRILDLLVLQKDDSGAIDVSEWAATEFMEEAATRLLQEVWEERTGDELGLHHARVG